MSLVEIARYQDVYEADLAAAFLASHGVDVDVTERFQTTVDPLMQRALGLRLMGRADQAAQARDLLARVRAGEFGLEEGDDLAPAAPGERVRPEDWPWLCSSQPAASPAPACRAGWACCNGRGSPSWR